jgi:OmpA-OmpF porin, OOP family
MKRFLGSGGAFIIATLLSATATHAQYRSFVTRDAGFYWWLDTGAVIPEDGHISDFGGFTSGQKVQYDVGFGLDVAGGYAFNRYFATELQLGGTWNSFSSVEGASIHDTSLSTVPILANVVLQYPIPRTVVVPYIGAGVGGAATIFDTDDFYMPVPGGSVSLHGSQSDFVFAWQGIAGVRFDLNQWMSLGVRYRYLYTDSSTYSFESYHHGPDFDLDLSSFHSHLVALIFQMKF